jgi:galacturonosyltransferase
MKKVMILANNDVGLYKFRKELIEVLLEEYEVHIVLPRGNFVDELVQMGCIFHATEFQRRGTNPFSDLALLNKYRSLLREVSPVAVLTYTIKPNIYGGIACAERNIPYIANITGLGTAVENAGVLQIITTTLYKFALRKAKKVFFQNEDNLLFMKNKGIVRANYDLLPGSGVNLKQYRAMPYPDGDTIDFIFVARVMKEKGIDQYLEAAEYITKKYPHTKFHICGFCEAEYEGRLEECQASGAVVYHGMVSNVREYIAQTHCTVHPTYYPEGLSNVLLESSACARPIITTDRSGCREVIDNGVNGFVVRQQDSQDLIEKIEQFLALSWEERKAMGLAGRAKVEREFDRQIVVEKYVAELNACPEK